MPVLSADLPRMQVNGPWLTPPIALQAGYPPAAVDATGWTVVATAKGAGGTAIDLTAGNARFAWLDNTRFQLSLTQADCAALGAGRVDIEIVRLAPQPAPKPLGRLTLINHPGIYAP